MADHDHLLFDRLDLADAVDHLLNKGAVLTGDATLALAGVDLVYVGLNVLVASVESLRERGGPTPPAPLPEGKGESSFNPGLPASRSGALNDTRPTAAGQDSPFPSGRGAGGVGPPTSPSLPASPTRLYADREMREVGGSPPDQGEIISTPEDAGGRPERGLAKLVLTLVELLRQILERQALRRVEGDTLSEEQIERMGIALMELEAKMAELRNVFELTEEDLTLDLGPLGRLQ